MNKHLAFLSALALSAGMNLNAQDANHMVIQANKIGAEIKPTMYGHFLKTSTMVPTEVYTQN